MSFELTRKENLFQSERIIALKKCLTRLKISREENWNRDEREEEEGLMKEKKEKRG